MQQNTMSHVLQAVPYRGQPIYGTILCYGWRNNRFQPLNKDLQAEMLDRLKDTEVRV